MTDEEKEYIEHEIVDRLYCLEEKDFDKTKVTDDYIQAVLKAGKENKKLIDKLQKRIDELENHVHYKNCIACGKEFRTKRSDTKYCALCSKFENNRNYYLSLTEEQKAKRREQAKICMRRLRAK